MRRHNWTVEQVRNNHNLFYTNIRMINKSKSKCEGFKMEDDSLKSILKSEMLKQQKEQQQLPYKNANKDTMSTRQRKNPFQHEKLEDENDMSTTLTPSFIISKTNNNHKINNNNNNSHNYINNVEEDINKNEFETIASEICAVHTFKMMIYVGINDKCQQHNASPSERVTQRTWRKKCNTRKQQQQKKEKPHQMESLLYKLDCIDAMTGRTITDKKKRDCEQTILAGNVFDMMHQPKVELEHLKMMAKEVEFKFKMPSNGHYFAFRLQFFTKKLELVVSLVSTPFLCRGRSFKISKKHSKPIFELPFLTENKKKDDIQKTRKTRAFAFDNDQYPILQMGSVKKKRRLDVNGKAMTMPQQHDIVTPIESKTRKLPKSIQDLFEKHFEDVRELLEQETDDVVKQDMLRQLQDVIHHEPVTSTTPTATTPNLKTPTEDIQQDFMDDFMKMSDDVDVKVEEDPFETLLCPLPGLSENHTSFQPTMATNEEKELPSYVKSFLTNYEQETYNGVLAYSITNDTDDTVFHPPLSDQVDHQDQFSLPSFAMLPWEN